MTDSGVAAWQRRIEVAEEAVAGSPVALQILRDEANRLLADPELLSTPVAAKEMSYFIALLRELGPVAEKQYGLAVRAITSWVEGGRVPGEHRCAVYNRIGTVLGESGSRAEAYDALGAALIAARTPSEQAYTLAQLGELAARFNAWSDAGADAAEAARLVPQDDYSATWLDIRMRSAYTLFRIEYRSPLRLYPERFGDLLRELVDVCGRQIDRWGNDHPRSLEALTIMTVAQRADAEERDDLAAMERFTDVLAVTAQRSASLLGARHPQAKAAREALLEVHPRTTEAGARPDERARSTSRPRVAENGPWRNQLRESEESSEGTDTAAARNLATTAVEDDSAPIADLRELITQARVVLWDFDGPICRLHAGHSAQLVATYLVEWLEERGLHGMLTDAEQQSYNPQVILRAVDRWHLRGDLVQELEERLTQEELRAVATAFPTAYADPLIRTWAALGTRQAIATNNSPRAVGSYLKSRGLISCFAQHVYGRTQDVSLLKPNPHWLLRGLSDTGILPSAALVIGDSPSDHEAARRAGIPFLGYARNEVQAKFLRKAGAELVVESLRQVLEIVRSQA